MEIKNRHRIWFFTKKEFGSYLIFLIIKLTLQALNVFITLRFINVQKAVQDGDVISNWKAFLLLSFLVMLSAAVTQVLSNLFGMKVSMYLRENFYRRYRKLIQTYHEPVQIKTAIIGSLIKSIDSILDLFFYSFLIFKTAAIIGFNFKTGMCAIALLVFSIFFGILRGFRRARIDKLNSAIVAKETNLVKFQSFSRDFLENSLTVLRQETNSKIWQNIKSNILSLLPTVFKEVFIIISIYGFINTLAENEVYSSGYIVITAFGTILTLSGRISSILEDVFSAIKNKDNRDVVELDRFERKEREICQKAKKSIIVDGKHALILKSFSADIALENGTSYYKLVSNLNINLGENIMLVGSKGTGKTRFLQLLETLFEDNVMIYNDRTTVFPNFYDNFKSEFGWNYEIIQKLAKGLCLNRLLLPEQRLKELKLQNLNTGDMHLMSALVMLYYAINKPQTARVVIFDELLANIDQQNAEMILKYTVEVCKKIGSTIIFVGHSQQKMIKPYCSSIWKMTSSGNQVLVEETTLS